MTTIVGKSTFGKRSTPELRERERADDRQREDEDGREDRTLDAERSKPLHDDLAFEAGLKALDCRRPSRRRRAADVRRRDALAGLRARGDLDQRSPTVSPVVTMRSSTWSPVDDEDAARAGDRLDRGRGHEHAPAPRRLLDAAPSRTGRA